MAAKVKLSIEKIEGQGIYIQRVVDGLRKLKADLQSLGCKVSVKVEGVELKAGNETRTRDILLGKKSVTVEGESVATPDTCPECGSPLITVCPPSDLIIKMFGQGQTFLECGHCGNCWAVVE